MPSGGVATEAAVRRPGSSTLVTCVKRLVSKKANTLNTRQTAQPQLTLFLGNSLLTYPASYTPATHTFKGHAFIF